MQSVFRTRIGSGCVSTRSLSKCAAPRPITYGTTMRMRMSTVRQDSNSSAAPTAGTKLFELHVNETTISVPFSAEAAKQFAQSFNTLLNTFNEKQKAERPKRWDLMEFKFKGDTRAGELEVFEVACNPNAYPTAFDAKMLITIKTKDGVKIMTEARLSQVKSDLGSFLS